TVVLLGGHLDTSEARNGECALGILVAGLGDVTRWPLKFLLVCSPVEGGVWHGNAHVLLKVRIIGSPEPGLPHTHILVKKLLPAIPSPRVLVLTMKLRYTDLTAPAGWSGAAQMV
ncbi:hypothetical protein HispidOSU_021255, partial [Sigmodon hispidus]